MKRLIQTAVVVLTIAVLGSVLRAGDITGQGMSQGDLFKFLSNVVTLANETKSDYNNSRSGMQAMCLSNAQIASAGTKLNVYPIDYAIAGVAYSKASAAYSLSASAQTANTSCKYLISVNAAGTATCTAGTEVADAGGSGAVTTSLPSIPSGHCPIGYVEVNASAAWTFGTSGFGVATTTIVNLSFIDGGSSVAASDLSLTGL